MQPTVLRVAKSMRERGFRVWVDTEMMSGSTLDAMAAAVEGAHCVLICITERYKARARAVALSAPRLVPPPCGGMAHVAAFGATRAGQRQLPARGHMCVPSPSQKHARAALRARGNASARPAWG